MVFYIGSSISFVKSTRFKNLILEALHAFESSSMILFYVDIFFSLAALPEARKFEGHVDDTMTMRVVIVGPIQVSQWTLL